MVSGAKWSQPKLQVGSTSSCPLYPDSVTSAKENHTVKVDVACVAFNLGMSHGGEGLTHADKLAHAYRLKRSPPGEFPEWPLPSTAEEGWWGSLPKVLLAKAAILDFGRSCEVRNVSLVCGAPRHWLRRKRGTRRLFPAVNIGRSPLMWWQLV